MTLRLATRRSPLAVLQAEYVQRRLAEIGHESELVLVETRGDRESEADLATIGGQGVFTVEVQRVVLSGDADVAVHSAKDLPSVTPDGLILASVPERLDPRDALIGRSLAGLGPGATVATGSPRRRALLLERRPDLNVVPLRGNMTRRLAAVGQGGVDAIVAAIAGLERLDQLDLVSEALDPSWFTPQVGQGALALEARLDDVSTRAALVAINDIALALVLSAERAFLAELGAGCSIPAGAYGSFDGDTVTLRGVMLAPDGTKSARGELIGDDPTSLGRDLARLVRDDLGGGNFVDWAG
ncbi:MAG TPA: hydroxymethylbilane synthase [Acidimicrobiales bacterium]|nr:hydroxymethylbilane synthase [Acidimicrobiales bacterium]